MSGHRDMVCAGFRNGERKFAVLLPVSSVERIFFRQADGHIHIPGGLGDHDFKLIAFIQIQISRFLTVQHGIVNLETDFIGSL